MIEEGGGQERVNRKRRERSVPSVDGETTEATQALHKYSTNIPFVFVSLTNSIPNCYSSLT